MPVTTRAHANVAPRKRPSPTCLTRKFPSVGDVVDILWEDRDHIFRGRLTRRTAPSSSVFRVDYDDGDVSLHDLNDMTWRFAPGTASSKREASQWFYPGDLDVIPSSTRTALVAPPLALPNQASAPPSPRKRKKALHQKPQKPIPNFAQADIRRFFRAFPTSANLPDTPTTAATNAESIGAFPVDRKNQSEPSTPYATKPLPRVQDSQEFKDPHTIIPTSQRPESSAPHTSTGDEGARNVVEADRRSISDSNLAHTQPSPPIVSRSKESSHLPLRKRLKAASLDGN